MEPLKCGWLGPALDAGFFHFAARIRGGDEWEEVPQGIFKPRRWATKTPSKIPETGAELEGRFAESEPLSPARQVLRHSGHSDHLGTKVL